MKAVNPPKRIIRIPEVTARTGLSRSTVYALMAKGRFPKGLKLSERARGWPEADVDAWVASRQAAA